MRHVFAARRCELGVGERNCHSLVWHFCAVELEDPDFSGCLHDDLSLVQGWDRL
jgi:hypothetical protein